MNFKIIISTSVLIIFLIIMGTDNYISAGSSEINGKIVFRGIVEDRVGFFFMNYDGSEKRQFIEGGDILMPNFSPDGTKLAYVKIDPNSPNEQIYVINLDHTENKNLNMDPFRNFRPSWSPDGSKIGFYSEGEGRRSFYIMDSSTGTILQDLGVPIAGTGLDWSPNERKLVFTTSNPGDWDIGIINENGFVQAMLTEDEVRDKTPSWSQDGNIVFSREVGDNFDIFIINKDGQGLKRLTNNPNDDHSPKWSPDGEKIVFVRQWDNLPENIIVRPGGFFPQAQIMTMDANGENQINITPDLVFANNPDWQENHCEILFDKINYFLGESAIITFQCEGLILNPNIKDTVLAHISSTTDHGGLDIELVEIDLNEKIFEGSVIFVNSDESSKNRLHVSNCDTIHITSEGASAQSNITGFFACPIINFGLIIALITLVSLIVLSILFAIRNNK